ncbi:MAG: hypothetical protein CME62_03400 [Halobacteriovoraceae bacterium]|nr:hypothetical protein [Halobacteriovoraceae bacterium]|tara:strand:+ start:32204 stop:32746 length:543 start_codon:yes stop_codon:yes gene_type:complete
MKKLNFVILFSFLISSVASAGTLIEPYAGMFLNSTYDGDVEGDLSGNAVGMRLGFQQLGFMAGLDGRRAFVNLEPETGDDADYTMTQLGFFVGYNFPVLLRVWGEYVFALDGVNDDDSDVKLKKGSGFLIGLGYSLLPFISLNLEYGSVGTTEIESSTGTSDLEIDNNVLFLSLSLPLTI